MEQNTDKYHQHLFTGITGIYYLLRGINKGNSH